MAGSRPRVLVVFVDALGPAQLAAAGARFHFLPHRRALDGVLGYSSGALATVLTGAMPSLHGRMCLFTQRAGDDDGVLAPLAWLGLLPRVLHERAALRRVAARALARAAGLTGYLALHRVPPEAFRWLDVPERDDLFLADDVGGAPTFLAEARRAGLSVYASPWQLPEAPRFAHARAALASRAPDLAFLYAAELDGTLHRSGNDSTATRETLGRIGDEIERARDALGRDGREVVTVIIGDHGMADVRRAVDPRRVLEAIRGVRVFVDSTMLRVWGDGDALARARVAAARAELPGVWLDEAALASRGAPVAGAPYGRAMFVLDEGAIFAPSYVGGRARGMHGYDVGSASARAAIASDRPIPAGCASIAGVAGLIRETLEIAA